MEGILSDARAHQKDMRNNTVDPLFLQHATQSIFKKFVFTMGIRKMQFSVQTKKNSTQI